MRIETLTLAVWLFLIPLAVDFKGAEAGGNVLQYVLVALALTGGIWTLTKTKGLRAVGAPRKLIVGAIALTLAGSLLGFLSNDVPLGNYGRLILAWVMFALGMGVASRLTHRNNHPMLTRCLLAGGAVSTLFTLAYGLTSADVGLGEIRYQILSPALLMFEALLLHIIIIERRRSIAPIFLIILCVVLQLISVTRSQILAFLIILLASFWLRSGSFSKSLHSTLRFSLPLGAALLVTALIAGLVVPELGDRWLARVFDTHEAGEIDPTTLSRIAEISDQLDQWGSSFWSVLFGKGYGAEYKWADIYTRDLSGTFNIENLRSTRNFFAGHNYWIHSLFSGGIIFGLPLPIAILFGAIVAIKRAHVFNRFIGTTPMNTAFTRGTLMTIAFLAYTIGGNPFGPRYSALLFGVSVGIMVTAYGLLNRQLRSVALQGRPLHPRMARMPRASWDVLRLESYIDAEPTPPIPKVEQGRPGSRFHA